MSLSLRHTTTHLLVRAHTSLLKSNHGVGVCDLSSPGSSNGFVGTSPGNWAGASSWLSPSMPRPRRSSTKKKVTRNPSSATKAQTNIVFGRWISSFIGVNVDEPNDAPDEALEELMGNEKFKTMSKREYAQFTQWMDGAHPDWKSECGLVSEINPATGRAEFVPPGMYSGGG